jgi:hypothetical protein
MSMLSILYHVKEHRIQRKCEHNLKPYDMIKLFCIHLIVTLPSIIYQKTTKEAKEVYFIFEEAAMKKQGIFLGVLLIGIGLYFLLNHFPLPFLEPLNSWPTFLLIIGLAFLFQAFLNHDPYALFPGILLFGFGIHFHASKLLLFWPNTWGIYTLIVSISFLITYQRTRNSGLFIGVLLLLLSLAELFYKGFQNWMDTNLLIIEKIWPIGFIGIGLYFLFFKK